MSIQLTTYLFCEPGICEETGLCVLSDRDKGRQPTEQASEWGDSPHLGLVSQLSFAMLSFGTQQPGLIHNSHLLISPVQTFPWPVPNASALAHS